MKFADYCWRDRVIVLLITSYDFSAYMLISSNRERCREKDFGWHIKGRSCYVFSNTFTNPQIYNISKNQLML